MTTTIYPNPACGTSRNTHPILINRPIVVTPKGARLCRPSEQVLDLLENPLPAEFIKEDGEPVAARPA